MKTEEILLLIVILVSVGFLLTVFISHGNSEFKRGKVKILEELYKNGDLSKDTFIKYRKQYKDYQLDLEVLDGETKKTNQC